jgi:hypothetical protein
MKFQADANSHQWKAPEGTSTTTDTAKAKTAKTSTSRGSSFSVNKGSFTGTIADIVPSEMQAWFGEIGAALGGIDINQPLTWTKDQVIAAKGEAANLDKKLLEIAEVKTAVMKYLAYAMKEAEFKADIAVAMAKAKGYVDKQQARAFLAYASYLRKAARLEKKVKATQDIINQSNEALESTFDDRKAKLLASINTQAKLGQATNAQVADLRNKRKQAIEAHKQTMAAYKQELATGHLTQSAAS